MKSDKRMKVVCAIIQNPQKQFLLVQRSSNMKHPLLWEFPGGKVQENETNETALHRELLEELDLSVAISRQGKSIVHTYKEKQIELIPFFCVIGEEKPTLKEHTALLWLEEKEAVHHQGLLEADVKLLKANV